LTYILMDMAKIHSVYACSACGSTHPKWLGKCPDCGGWDTLTEELGRPTRKKERSRLSLKRRPEFLSEVDSRKARTQSTGIPEFDRAIGGGLVAGSVSLLGGEPGIGKSTLILQVADCFGQNAGPVIYATGEESPGQIKRRAERLGVVGSNVALLSSTDLEEIQAAVLDIKPSLLIVDSVQTTASALLESPSGSVAQVRAVAQTLSATAKPSDTAVMLIGHVTKEGSLAGPKVLEHLVDSVLTLESDSSRQYRLLRATKNRFGATDEVGLFEMTSAGMVPVDDPSHLFLTEDDQSKVGSVVVSAVEGSRPLLFDLQALVAPPGYSTSQRVARGLDGRRLAMLLAVAERKGGLKLSDRDVFINVTGGLTIDEPALDLGVIMALSSSFNDRIVPNRTIVVGEVGLGGEVRAVSRLSKRLGEAARLGFKNAVIPMANKELKHEGSQGLKITQVATVTEAIQWLDGT
jgi:DNA repair protein RadA/Sms